MRARKIDPPLIALD